MSREMEELDGNPQAQGMLGALRIERVMHAHTKVELWRARYELAAHMLDCAQRELAKREAENRGEPAP